MMHSTKMVLGSNVDLDCFQTKFARVNDFAQQMTVDIGLHILNSERQTPDKERLTGTQRETNIEDVVETRGNNVQETIAGG